MVLIETEFTYLINLTKKWRNKKLKHKIEEILLEAPKSVQKLINEESKNNTNQAFNNSIAKRLKKI